MTPLATIATASRTRGKVTDSPGTKTRPVADGRHFAVDARLSVLHLAHTSLYQQPAAFWQIGNELNRITPPDALVLIADDGDPRAIYYSNRRGWHFLEDGLFKGYPADTQQAVAWLEKYRKAGATYVAFPKDALWWFDQYKGFHQYLDSRYRRRGYGRVYFYRVICKASGFRASRVALPCSASPPPTQGQDATVEPNV